MKIKYIAPLCKINRGIVESFCAYVEQELSLCVSVTMGSNKRKKVYGYCLDSKRVYINLYLAESLGVILDTLAHEMVHCHQFATGTLSHRTDGALLWQGEFVEEWQEWGCEVSPWEIDAVTRGEKLFESFLQAELSK